MAADSALTFAQTEQALQMVLDKSSLDGHSTPIEVTTTPTIIAGFTIGNDGRQTTANAVTGVITTGRAGRVKVGADASWASDAGKDYVLEFYKNGNATGEGIWRDIATQNDQGSGAGTLTTEVVATDTIDLRISINTGTATASFNSITIHQDWET